jgi:hypothetical protein
MPSSREQRRRYNLTRKNKAIQSNLDNKDPNIKWCTKCWTCRKISEFSPYSRATKAYKKGDISMTCKKCVNKYSEHRAKVYDQIIEHRQENPCSICGEDDFTKLQHVNEKEKIYITDKMSIKTIQESLENYVVYCANCKSIKYYEARTAERKPEEELSRRHVSNRKKRDELHTYVNDIKSKTGCQDEKEICKVTDFRCLQFDHIDPNNKISSISDMISNYSIKEEIDEEIAKCRVLCANHHQKHTNHVQKESVYCG